MSAATISPPTLFAAIKTTLRPTLSICRISPRQLSQYSTASEQQNEVPRWAQTPKAMAMPVCARPGPRQRQAAPFVVNQDPQVLDDAYREMLGKGGESLLPEELKWLAVTHKSFDHARRGFNDKLAFLGKRIVEMQCSLALLNMPSPPVNPNAAHRPYNHVALQGLDNITSLAKLETLSKNRLASLARQYRLDSVVRWKPRNVDNLRSSGVDVVLTHTLYSIVGALAMERGGDFANKIVRERILSPLGLK